MPRLKRRIAGIAEGEPIPGGGGNFPTQPSRGQATARRARTRAYRTLATLPRARGLSEEQRRKLRRQARAVWAQRLV